MSQPAVRRFSFFGLFLGVASAALAVLVVVLARQNQGLRAQLERARAQAARATAAAAGLERGARMAAVPVVNASGAESMLPLDGTGRRLVLVASAQCHTCEAVQPFWRDLVGWAGTAQVEAMCVFTDKLPGGGDAWSAPVYKVRGFEQSPLAKVPMVPAVLLLRDGAVEHIWLGTPEPAAQNEMIAALGGG